MVKKVRPSLVDEVCGQVRDGISSARYLPGARLPSEAELGEQLGVSRTVVREAVVRLATEGLVEARHGAGVFVSETPNYQAFQIRREELENLQDVIQLLELRLAVEAEMASLAAERRSDQQVDQLRKWFDIMRQPSDDVDSSVAADVAFHGTIAEASKNAYYIRFNIFLGIRLVPPRSLVTRSESIEAKSDYIATIQNEHEAILDAIADSDPDRARLAAWTHMNQSLKRHRAIADSP